MIRLAVYSYVLLLTFCGAQDDSIEETSWNATVLRGGVRRGGSNRDQINSEVATSGQVGYHATILRRTGVNVYSFQCSGSLITSSYVLTSRQCIDGVSNSTQIVVSLGGISLNESSTATPPALLTDVANIIRYLTNDRDDLALLRLQTPVDLTGNNRITTIELASSSGNRGGSKNTYTNTRATLSGWALARERSTTEYHSLKVSYHWVMKNGRCRAWSRRNFQFTLNRNQICTRWDNYNQCIADLGSPLVARNRDGNLVQIGIASYNLRSCTQDPIIFTSVSQYSSWIRTQIGN